MPADMQQRTRLAAGLLGCPESEVLPRVQQMSAIERRSLTGWVNWLVDYESEEGG